MKTTKGGSGGSEGSPEVAAGEVRHRGGSRVTGTKIAYELSASIIPLAEHLGHESSATLSLCHG